jgi:hypothetical protein
MPAGRFLSFLAQGLALAPSVSFPNVPGIHFNDQGKRLQSQFKLEVVVLLRTALWLAHLPVHLLSLLLGALALLAGLSRQGGR